MSVLSEDVYKSELIAQFKKATHNRFPCIKTSPLFLTPARKSSIFPISQLDDFLERQLQSAQNIQIARYVVTHQKTMLLAPVSTPHHEIHSDAVLAAGYIFFHEKTKEVTGLSSQCDDYQGLSEEYNTQCMLWPTLILALIPNIKIANSFSLISATGTTTLPQNERDALLLLLPEHTQKEMKRANTQQTNTTNYTNTGARNTLFHHTKPTTTPLSHFEEPGLNPTRIEHIN